MFSVCLQGMKIWTSCQELSTNCSWYNKHNFHPSFINEFYYNLSLFLNGGEWRDNATHKTCLHFGINVIQKYEIKTFHFMVVLDIYTIRNLQGC